MSVMYTVVKTTRFKRDYKRLMRQGLDMTDLNSAIGQLALNGKLPPRYKDHPLKGNGLVAGNVISVGPRVIGFSSMTKMMTRSFCN